MPLKKDGKISPMKRNLFLSFLFLCTTLFASIHESEHIKGHDHTKCQICVINANMAAPDSVSHAEIVSPLQFDAIALENKELFSHAKIFTYNAQAPPLSPQF